MSERLRYEQLTAHYASKFGECGLPLYMWQGMKLYLMHGVPPGGFLQAVLSNRLASAVMKADGINNKLLPNYVNFMYTYMPSGSWGNEEKYEAWLERCGHFGPDMPKEDE